MIKHDGVDIPRIEYIDPVDGKVSILRVMQDGVQIWPSASEVPNIPTGIQLSEYEIVDTLEIPTGITLREVMNIPTGITLREVQTIPDIDWDYTKMYIGEGDNTNLVTLYFTGQDADITSIPGNLDWVLYPFNVINTVTVYTDRVELLVNTPFTSASSVTIDYTPGVNPLKDIDGHLLTALNNQPLDNVLPVGFTYLLDDYPGAAGAYSLRKLSSASTLAVRVRRSGDNNEVDVLLYDDPTKSIDKDSLVSIGGTLGAWTGVQSVYIRTWYDQSGNANDSIQTIGVSQPILLNSSVLVTENGKAAIESRNTAVLRTASSGYFENTWSIHGVMTPSTLATGGTTTFLNKHSGGANLGRIIFLQVSDADLTRNMFFNNGTSIQGLYSKSWAVKQYSFSNYADSNDYRINQNGEPMELAISGQDMTPEDTPFNIGSYGNNTASWKGTYQEAIVYTTNQEANREAIQDNINDFYNIYVVTAEVDAQLIQADNDGLSDTVIEINGVRSSVSDTAVANLISRNVTVITN